MGTPVVKRCQYRCGCDGRLRLYRTVKLRVGAAKLGCMFWFFLRFLLVEWIADLLWWWWADRRLRRLARARWLRAAVAAFVLFQTVSFLLIIASRLKGFELPLPAIPLAAVYLWHLLLLPLS